VFPFFSFVRFNGRAFFRSFFGGRFCDFVFTLFDGFFRDPFGAFYESGRWWFHRVRRGVCDDEGE
jgi:hypothetical protein